MSSVINYVYEDVFLWKITLLKASMGNGPMRDSPTGVQQFAALKICVYLCSWAANWRYSLRRDLHVEDVLHSVIRR